MGGGGVRRGLGTICKEGGERFYQSLRHFNNLSKLKPFKQHEVRTASFFYRFIKPDNQGASYHFSQSYVKKCCLLEFIRL